MPTARWGAAIGVLALGGAVILRRPELPPPAREEVQAAEPALTLVVAIDAVRLDLRRVHLCLTPMRHEERPVEHRGELAADGRFHFTGLADTDYRLELLTRDEPSLVLARADFVRPRAEPFRLVADLAPLASPSPDTD